MLQPTRVLPSNAPPLRDSDSVHQASRVLQEHSGNRQQADYSNTDTVQQKFTTPVFTENAWPNYAPHQRTHQLYHPQPQVRQSWPLQHGRRYAFGTYEDEQKRQFLASQLYKRFKDAPQYNKYRQRQAKEDKAGQEQKWPDHLEEAFFYALVRWEPMGRRKFLWKGKLRGRNELISDTIMELTGVDRGRKQVSSHIQVLKPFVETDPYIMQYLSKHDMAGRSPRVPGGQNGIGLGRRMSTYPTTGLRHSTRRNTHSALRNDIANLSKVKHNLDVFEPTSFSMFVQRKTAVPGGGHQEERLHTYTRSIERPLGPDQPVQDWVTFGQKYPCLAAMHAKKPLDCNVLVADSSLGLTTDSFRDKDGIELGISFLCSSRYVSSKSELRCCNNFYRNNRHLSEYSSAFDVELSDDKNGMSTSSIKFGSTFWARTLGQLAVRLRENADNPPDHHNSLQDSIGGITAVQEVVAVSESGAERLLIMFWTFRQSSAATGRTSWRRLVLPGNEEQKPYCDPVSKTARVDSVYDYGPQFAEVPATQTQTQPALQSPFEYESSSSSAPSSATWPTSMDDGSGMLQPTGDASFLTDNDLDFTSGNINMAFDPTHDFSNFDSTAFDFDTCSALGMDYTADPALEQFSQQWCGETYATGFDEPVPLGSISEDTTFVQPLDGQTQTYNAFVDQYDPQMYGASSEQQAFGGAGQDGMKHEGDALAALADASYVAQTLAARAAST